MFQRMQPHWRNIALGVIAVLVMWFCWTVRSALNPLGVGLLFAYMLHPMVVKLERRGFSRKVAVNLIFGGTFLGVGLMCVALVFQARDLWADLSTPQGALAQIDDRINDVLTDAYEWLDESEFLPDADPDAGPDGEQGAGTPGVLGVEEPPQFTLQAGFEQLQAWLAEENRLASAGQAGLAAAGGIWAVLRRVFGSLLSVGTFVFLVPIYTWFLLFELERIGLFVTTYIPAGERQSFSNIGSKIAEMLGNFFRGRMVVCLLKGGLLSVVLYLAGVPYALLLGMISGFLSLIPFLGPTIGYGLAFLLALLEYSVGEAVLRIAIVYTIGELIEGYVLLPRVLGDSMGLHPVVVVASLMVFGAALGMFGLLLALPITSAVVIVAQELVLPALKDFAEERSTS